MRRISNQAVTTVATSNSKPRSHSQPLAEEVVSFSTILIVGVMTVSDEDSSDISGVGFIGVLLSNSLLVCSGKVAVLEGRPG